MLYHYNRSSKLIFDVIMIPMSFCPLYSQNDHISVTGGQDPIRQFFSNTSIDKGKKKRMCHQKVDM